MKKRSFWIMLLVLIGLAALILALLMQVRPTEAPDQVAESVEAGERGLPRMDEFQDKQNQQDGASRDGASHDAASRDGVSHDGASQGATSHDSAARDTLQDAATWRPADLFPATREYRGPDFELADREGMAIRLSDYDGRIVVLNLWATWCPPCRDEVPALIRLQEEYGEAGVQVIGVSLDENDENGARQAVADFAESFGINYPVPVDDGTVQQEYGPLSVIPTTYFLDRNRHIRFYAPGYLDYEQMEEAVRDLLSD